MPYSRRAEFYDVEYVEDRDCDFALSLIDDGARALEVPCGAGRLSRRLAERAGELTIVDIEPNMLSRAIANVARGGGGARVTGEIADMRRLDLRRVFDVALVPREALQLLAPPDALHALFAISAHVAPGGLLFVDLATFRGADPDYYDPQAPDGVWRDNWTRRLSDGAELTRRSAQTHATGAIGFELDYCVRREPDDVRRWRSHMKLHRYDRRWVETATPPDMTLAAIYGDYDRSDYSDIARRLLAIYRRLPPFPCK